MKRIGLSSLAIATALGVAAFAEVQSKPWLGVMLSPVSGATAKQLAIEPDTGIMVTNVAENSPAADAGIEQYDIIVDVNGQPVSSDFAAFSDEIASVGVGGRANLTVIRGGQQVSVTAVLAEMPPPDQIQYLHDNDVNVVTQLDRDVFGKILEHDDQGNWVMRDLGKLDDLQNLFGSNDVGVFAGNGLNGQTTFNINTDGTTREMKVIRDGKMIDIQEDENGQIIVRRGNADDDSTVTEQVYDSEEALQNGDDEAYELFKQFSNGTGAYAVVTPDAKFRIEFNQNIADALAKANQAIADARAATDDAGAQLQDHMRSFQMQSPQWQNWPNFYRFNVQAGQPRTSFKLNADGTIEVTTRDGDTVLTRNYDSADDLQQRDPKLYEKYQSLRDAE